MVPLCFEKSMWTVVAVLAVMEAGGAFTLTHPSQPEARLQMIGLDVGAKVVLTSGSHALLGSRVAPTAKVHVASRETFDGEPSPINSLPSVPASTTMYIFSTSGSTGKRKGVVISHTNYTSGALPLSVEVDYDEGSRVLDFVSYTFDVIIDFMMCTLILGDCTYVSSDEARIDDFSGVIRSMNVNMAHMTPSVARVLEPHNFPQLKILGLGGEAVLARDAANGIVDVAEHNCLVPIGAVGELLVEGPVVDHYSFIENLT
ncbi:hypothetical protein BDY21DRAFT_393629 [Lineolata rhizophorae]|uniref:AMP-dependent synthetase/ligase domain-containing protein n=1 Tax=Lineolata rhizophorae TaxID=578093 RepID=A0A6A6NXD9_9PEZI|nr:hypothetical protein BDY21DRAFT_393629 [Lineolata rhizophorae]